VSHDFPPDEDDLIFFRNAMKNVRRIKRSATLKKSAVKKNTRLNPSHKSVSKNEQVHSTDKDIFLSLVDPVEQAITAEDKLFFKRQGPQNKVIKKLIRGEIIRFARLDLHGMTIAQARLATINFLTTCRKANFRCVQIIHGKGQLSDAKLKNHINYWLPQIPWVLAFSSAKAKDGGKGAVYVLLAKS
jgi:DNA-nicking Smr family endonuclease